MTASAMVRVRAEAGERMGKKAQQRRAAKARQALADVRQLRYPKEFRISPPPWDEQWLTALEALGKAPAARPVVWAEPPTAQPVADHGRLFAEIATGLWRLRGQLLDPETDRPRQEMRRAYRHLESIWDALAQAGIAIQDHTGALFDAGMALRVIAYQPAAGVSREAVIETLRPSVYYENRPIQMGEVIVGTPIAADEESVERSVPEPR